MTEDRDRIQEILEQVRFLEWMGWGIITLLGVLGAAILGAINGFVS